MAAGEPAFLSEEYANDLDPDLELVTTSGYGKNGAISVLQVRKEKLSSFSLWFWWIEIQSLLTISKSEMFKFNFKRILLYIINAQNENLFRGSFKVQIQQEVI